MVASALANMAGFLALLTYAAAMAAPWWHTSLQGLESENTNCFFDGSCINGNVIFKNNGNSQWIYTAVIVFLSVGWVPFLIFLHLLWFRSSKHHYSFPGRRSLMILNALLATALLIAALIVFAAGIVEENNLDGLYGEETVPFPGGGFSRFSWGAGPGWYFTLITIALIPLAAFCGLAMRTKSSDRRVERVDRPGFMGTAPSSTFTAPVAPTTHGPVAAPTTSYVAAPTTSYASAPTSSYVAAPSY